MRIKQELDSMAPCSSYQGSLPITDELAIQYTLLKGQASQPLLTISAAVHGCEYVGVKALMDLAHEWDFNFQGSVLLLHAVNVSGFWARETTLVPEDGLNLNRIFQDQGPVSSLSYHIRSVIESQVFSVSDFLIDLHSGNREELLTPHGYYSLRANPEVMEKSYQMLQASGTPIIYQSQDRGNLYHAASVDYGLPSILLEQGENGTCLPEDVLAMKESVKQVARYLFEGVMPYYKQAPLIFDDSYYLTCQRSGCWMCFVRPNQTVQAGQVIGEICDIYGNILEKVTAKEDGLVLYQKATLVVHQGEVLLAVASKKPESYQTSEREAHD